MTRIKLKSVNSRGYISQVLRENRLYMVLSKATCDQANNKIRLNQSSVHIGVHMIGDLIIAILCKTSDRSTRLEYQK